MFRVALPTRTCSGAKWRLWIGVATVAVLFATAAPAQGAPFVYIANDYEISQYEVVAGGLLAPMDPATVATPGVQPSAVAVSPDGESVYVPSYKNHSVSQYDVGPGGELSPKSPATVATGDERPWRVTVSPDGQSVYVISEYLTQVRPYPGGGVSGIPRSNVWQYAVGPGGGLSPKSPATVAAGVLAMDVKVSPDSQSVYVPDEIGQPCWAGGPCIFDVRQYDVGAGGELSPKSPATVDSGGGEPHAVAVSPDGESLYVTNQCARKTNFCSPDEPGNVAQYDVGPGGELSPKSPATVATAEGAGSVAVSPGGESVYVANQSPWDGVSGYVSQYDVGPGGKLSPKSPARVAAGEGLGSIAVSPDGASVYVINHRDGSLSQYDVGAGGELSPKTPATMALRDRPEAMAVSPALGATASKQCKRAGWKKYGFNKRRGCIRFVTRDARHSCLAARRVMRRVVGRYAFRKEYGKGRHHRRAMRRCVKQESRR